MNRDLRALTRVWVNLKTEVRQYSYYSIVNSNREVFVFHQTLCFYNMIFKIFLSSRVDKSNVHNTVRSQ